MLQANVPAWFEIPTADIDRAQRFYERLLGVELKREAYQEGLQAIFPGGCPPLSSGALVQRPGHYAPSATAGSVVYLAVDDVRLLLERVREAGGEVLQPLAGVPGTPVVYAHIRDSEGNRVGLASVDGTPA
ncbi:VOC family protein [Agrilutibacter solisilvae]|uniref:VOC family protein n=1 Tax=Agrilutibacter solisilvae TaxID=2763317 RepID=A0A974Y0M9_9GAMM|nr:VOC family protein [Lysobacter solisilvae]QSX79139.1 VOC family protein [Lysobacter solisilvae]